MLFLVQSRTLLSPPPPLHIGAEPERAKGGTLLSPARVQPLCGGGGGGKKGEFRDWTMLLLVKLNSEFSVYIINYYITIRAAKATLALPLVLLVRQLSSDCR